MQNVHLQCLHELPRARTGDGSKVINQVCFSHAHTCVYERDGVVIFVWNQRDLELFLGIQHSRVGQALVSNFIQGLRGKHID